MDVRENNPTDRRKPVQRTPSAEALNAGSSSLLINREILLNTVFLSELVPFRAVLESQATTAVGLAVTLLLALVFGKLSCDIVGPRDLAVVGLFSDGHCVDTVNPEPRL